VQCSEAGARFANAGLPAIVPRATLEGLENTPKAFIALLQGENTGKMLVRVADP